MKIKLRKKKEDSMGRDIIGCGGVGWVIGKQKEGGVVE